MDNSTKMKFVLSADQSHEVGVFDVEALTTGEQYLGMDPAGFSYCSVLLTLDDHTYDYSLFTWAGTSLSTEELFESVLNAYLRDDTKSYIAFGKNWKKYFGSYRAQNYGGLALPVARDGKIRLFELQLETENYKFYHLDEDNEYLALYVKDNSILTTSEPFYMSALCEELEDIARGDTSCKYIHILTRWYAKNELDLDIDLKKVSTCE